MSQLFSQARLGELDLVRAKQAHIERTATKAEEESDTRTEEEKGHDHDKDT